MGTSNKHIFQDFHHYKNACQFIRYTSNLQLLVYFSWVYVSLHITHIHSLSYVSGWPDRAIWTTGDMQRDGDGDGTFSSQGGHSPLCLCLVTRGFDPGATQVGQLVELDAVLLQDCWAVWWRTCFCEWTERFFVFVCLFSRKAVGYFILAKWTSAFLSLSKFELINKLFIPHMIVRIAERGNNKKKKKTLRSSKDKRRWGKEWYRKLGGVFSEITSNPELSSFANRKQNNESCSWTSTAEWLLFCFMLTISS